MKKWQIILLLLVLGTGGYFGYSYFFGPNKDSAWSFVSRQSAIVFDVQSILLKRDSLQKAPIWKAIEQLPGMKRLDSVLMELEAIDSTTSLAAISEGSHTLVAISAISSDEFDIVFIHRLRSNEEKRYWTDALDAYRKSGFQTKTRNYNGYELFALYRPGSGREFTYLVEGDFIVGSFTPFLVEDVVRTLNAPDLALKVSNTSTMQLEEKIGRVVINLDQTRELLEVFNTGVTGSLASLLSFEFEQDQKYITLSGFGIPEEHNFLSKFTTGPGSFDLLDVIPNSAAVMEHFSYQDPAAWDAQLLRTEPSIGNLRTELKNAFDLDFEFMIGNLDDESAVVQLELVEGSIPDRLVFFESKSIEDADDFLRQAGSRLSIDSLFEDRMGDFVIRRLDDRIPRALMGAKAGIEGDCYYMINRDFIVFSNSIMQLKRLAASIQIESTWKKSLQVSQVIERGNSTANYTLMINVPRAWNHLRKNLKPAWKDLFEANRHILGSFEFGMLQFSRVEKEFYSNAVIYQPKPPKERVVARTERGTPFPHLLRTKPYLVRSHVDQSWEVLFQDTTGVLYHVDKSFETLWSKEIGSPILSDIIPVDFYKNGKIQYAFMTSSEVHILDRNGNYINGYPLKVPTNSPLVYFDVVDYDGSKNYRWMCTDAESSIFLFNKEGKGLDGWSPRKSGALIMGPRHIRVAGRDAFILVGRNGMLDMVTRRGSSYPGFPVDLKTRLVPSYFTEATGSFETSVLTTLSETGELIKLNFGGRILSRDQLLKESLETTFDLIPDALGNTYLIARTSGSKWEVLDASGAVLFNKTYVGKKGNLTQFYRFGGDRTLLLNTDMDQSLLNAYDMTGQVLTARPLRSSHEASVLFLSNEGKYQLYLISGNSIEKVELN